MKTLFAAVLHWIVGAIIPFMAFVLPIHLLFSNSFFLLNGILLAAAIPTALWLGPKWSASFLKSEMTITDPKKIVDISSVFVGVVLAMIVLSALIALPKGFNLAIVLSNVVGPMGGIMTFYASSKYHFTDIKDLQPPEGRQTFPPVV